MRFTLKRFYGFLSSFKRSKRGLAGLAILLIFTLVAAGAPLLAHHDPVNDFFVAGYYAKPDWYDTLFPNEPQSRNIDIVPNKGFNDSSTMKDFNITTASSQISSSYVSSIGRNSPGCVSFTYRRTGVKGGTHTLNLSKMFTYSYTAPLARFLASAEFYVGGSTFVDARSQTKLDVPVKIDIYIKRLNGTAVATCNLLDVLYAVRALRAVPSPVTDPTDSWLPIGTSSMDSTFMIGRLGLQYGYLMQDFIDAKRHYSSPAENTTDPATLIFDQTGTFIYSVELTFQDDTYLSKNTSVETTVYVDDVDFSGLGSAYGVLGTDTMGRDIFSQLIYGSRISLLVGITSAIIAVAIGLVVGMVAGYQGGIIDELLMRITDALLVVPYLPLLLVLVAVLGNNLWNLIGVIGVLGWMGFARVVRSMILSLKERPFIESAKAIGAGNVHIMTFHILPNVMALVYVTLAMTVPNAIVSEAALSFLGFFDPNVMSWGRMLNDVQTGFNMDKWWWVVPPGLLISFVALAFIFVGYALDDVLNPKLRQRR